MLTRRKLTMAAAAAMLGGTAARAQAPGPAGWPSKPIRWIVNFPPAGAADILSRTLAEYYGDVRYYVRGVLAAQTVAASGNVQPERLRSQELGYLGRFPASALTLDLRVYRERMDSVIHNVSANRATPLPVSGYDIIDFVNCR